MSVRTIRPRLLRGTVPAPPSKSCHHRLLLATWLAGAAPGALPRTDDESADIAATRRCLAALSAAAAGAPGPCVLDVGESGSTLRFLLPLATQAAPEVEFRAAGRLPQRPIRPFLDLLSTHGLEFPGGDAFPLRVRGSLRPGEFRLRGDVSSQIVTGLLFALPALSGDSEIRLTTPLESRGYIDLTLATLAQCGIRVETLPDGAGWRVPGGQRWALPRAGSPRSQKEAPRTPRSPREDHPRAGSPRSKEESPRTPRSPRENTPRAESPRSQEESLRTPHVEGDWSGAAFWLVAGALGSDIAVTGLDPDSAQPDRAVLDILRRMGADIEIDRGTDGLAAVRARAPKGGLRACEIDVSQCPDLLPALAVAAARARGDTRFVRAARLRLKESDRIAAMEEVLARFGVATESTPDSLTVHGRPSGRLRGGGDIPVAGDHRIAMAAAVAATVADAPVALPGAECVAKSYPAFFQVLERVRRRPWPRALAAVAAAGALFLLALNGTVLACSRGRVFTRAEDLPHRNAAVVLGCVKTLRNGRENQYFRTRIDAAARLYHTRKVAFVIVSGDNHVAGYDEPTDMKAALVDLGVPEDRIVCDYAGFRTLDSVVRASAVFQQDDFILVSQPFHLRRALFLARCRGIHAIGYAAGEVRYGRRTILLRQICREQLARVAALLDVIIRRPPRFYGPPETPPVRYVPSPNHSERLRPVSIIVLHYTETPTLEQAVRILTATNTPKLVSSHYVVGLDGEIVQLVPEDRRAWHAGISSWRGVPDVNSASIGIEIVNAGPGADGAPTPYPEAQIAAVCGLCRDIQAHYAIEDVVGHSDVAPTRKRDPGPGFPWSRLAREGIGLWTDEYADSDESVPALLTSIGYDVANEKAALLAFQHHFYPEAVLSGGMRTRERLAAVAAAFRAARGTSGDDKPRQESGCRFVVQ